MFSQFKKSNGLIKRCPKTGKFRGFNLKGANKLLFPILGLASIVWFLIRVLPKPSRASYPCMKVAAPMASGFIVWLTGLGLSTLAIKKAHEKFASKRYVLVAIFAVAGFLGTFLMTGSTSTSVVANIQHEDFTPNKPMGEAKGIFPGRVVWAWNPDATNESCTNSYNKKDGWFLPKNNDQDVIDKMLTDAVLALTGKETNKEAWDAIFRFNNNMRGKGDVPYEYGEVVYIKTNATSSYGMKSDFTPGSGVYGIAETNPHLVLAVLRQLVNVVGVDQQDIYIGDPLKNVYKHCYDLWTAEFPDIVIIDNDYGSSRGRYKVVPMSKPIMKYSDRGDVMMTGDWQDPFAGEPTQEDTYYKVADFCEYLINIPTMKGHKRAGITMFAKNHFGSHTRSNAVHLHGGLVNPTESDAYRQARNLYRVQVDLMGHEIHYKKGLFYLMDALYSGSEATDPPRKFKMAPFDNDWTSSIFLSQDPVAIESVGYDFLRTEFDKDSKYPYPSMGGVDDYLHQAADQSEWPEGISYDPEDDGTPISSLGVHEHWNDAVNMQYSRDLATGDGIELYKIKSQSNVDDAVAPVADFTLYQNFPNPFNPQTTIQYDLDRTAEVGLEIFNMAGQHVYSFAPRVQQPGTFTFTWNAEMNNGADVPSGVYVYRLTVNDGSQIMQKSHRMVLMK